MHGTCCDSTVPYRGCDLAVLVVVQLGNDRRVHLVPPAPHKKYKRGSRSTVQIPTGSMDLSMRSVAPPHLTFSMMPKYCMPCTATKENPRPMATTRPSFRVAIPVHRPAMDLPVNHDSGTHTVHATLVLAAATGYK